MESRSWYEQQKAVENIARKTLEEARGPRGTVAEGYVGSRKERRAQAAQDRKQRKRRTVTP